MSKTKTQTIPTQVFDCFNIYYLLIITIPDFKLLAVLNPMLLGF